MAEFRQKIVNGALWALLEKFTTQLASFGVTLVLARLLTPDDYGVVALLTVLVTISGIIVDGSFSQALVQKKDSDELDFNSVFYMVVAMSFVVYSVLFLIAPEVARFYDKPELSALFRVLSLIIIFNAINSIQAAELSKKMLFKLSFKISLVRFLVTSITGVTLALLNYGAWALIWSAVAGSLGTVIASWFFVSWRPKLMFSFTRLKILFSFGWKMSLSWFLSLLYDNLNSMVIGKMYAPADLAFYEKGRQVPFLAMSSIGGTLQRVSFPAMAMIQDDKTHVRTVMRRMIQCSTFLVFPMMTGMAVCADNLVPVLFGDQWRAAVPFVSVCCFTFLLYPFHTINLQTLSAIGRSDIFLKLEIVKKVVAFTALLCSCRYGVMWIVLISAFVVGPIGVCINAFPNKKILGYSVVMQVKDTIPTALLCVAMATVIFPIRYLPVNTYCQLTLQIAIGMFTYFSIAWLLRMEALREYLSILNDMVSKRVSVKSQGLYVWFIKRVGVSDE